MEKPRHIDHIDPKWEEGRDYQLVCGLDLPVNFAEREPALNISKSNRFLPYKHPAPEQPGDWTYFLGPDTNDWVYAEFMGDWWWEKTTKTQGKSAAKVGKPRPDLAERNRERKGESRTFSDEHRANLSKSGKGRKFSDESRARMSASAKKRCSNPEWKRKASETSKRTAANNKRNNKGQFS